MEEREVRVIPLASSEDEERLWSTMSWYRDDGALRFRLVAGPLAWQAERGPIPLVVIRDLTSMSLSTARACVMLIGADVAHLERHGRQERWRPLNAWIAACPLAAAGQVSPHLMDRFAVRVPSPQPQERRRHAQALLTAATGAHATRPHEGAPDVFPLAKLKQARDRRPRPGSQTLDRVLDLAQADCSQGMRRELTLARIAVAEAKLAGASVVEVAHVERAATLLGLAPQSPAERDVPEVSPGERVNAPAVPPEPATLRREHLDARAISDASPAQLGAEPTVLEPVMAADPAEPLEPVSLPGLGERKAVAYPEDEAPVERELEPLRAPASRGGMSGAGRGVVVGVEPATDVCDLAITSTILEALKFQPARTKHHPHGEGLLLSPTDLRSYRRAASAATMLTLVLDCTCGESWDWTATLMPFLQWGYVERASVCLVTVGSRNAASELRAERMLARNLLDRRVAAALQAPAGRATPLAHGLDLALQTLRHALHHGRQGVLEASLVVISDGRGNVPLEASLTGTTPTAVGRRGIEDAFAVAERIRALDRVRTVVIDPEPEVSADLPHALARALGATVAPRKPEGGVVQDAG